MNDLTKTELTELAQHERTIEQGLTTFREVGAALMAIRDSRLYRQSYGTFEAYCKERWGMGRSRVYQLIDAAETVAALSAGELLAMIQEPPLASELRNGRIGNAASDPTERAALASEAFGRAGRTLLPLFVEGPAGLKALTEEASRLGLVMNEEAVTAAANLDDKLVSLKSQLGARPSRPVPQSPSR